MKKSELRNLIREEIKRVLSEKKLNPGSAGTEMIFSPLEDDMIGDWKRDSKIKKWTNAGLIGLNKLSYDSWEVWANSGDREVSKYVKDNYSW